ncbi:MAG: hypothetical protein H6631_03375 [Anaerolineaceae bacterium]|nr:hypothetical protein [Anaerolineaceae bacterium]
MKKILFIGGSLNQTKIAHAVARHLARDYACCFTPYYCDGLIELAAGAGLLDFTVIGGNARAQTEAYLQAQRLPVDYGGRQHDYDLVVTTSDLLIQDNIRHKKIVLVQEGMTDRESLMFYLVKWLKIPRYLASTATNGLSNAYEYFCVASAGYRDFFIKKGVQPDKLVVTGIPNFDDVAQFKQNDFPYKKFVLVATSDARETFKFDNRKKFIRRCLRIADDRPLIFKLHPNENVKRATREIKALAPQALVFANGSIEPMIANCDVLITQYSTVVYLGLALGKEVHSYFDIETLKKMTPIQNGGASGRNIAAVCRRVLEGTAQPERSRPEQTPIHHTSRPTFHILRSISYLRGLTYA